MLEASVIFFQTLPILVVFGILRKEKEKEKKKRIYGFMFT
jgi:hypothetical protein